jgi:YD repeat-containing protein
MRPFRIVQEKRGDIVTGIRVQQRSYRYHYDDQGNRTETCEVWRNRGRRVFTVEAAVKLRDFLRQQQMATTPPAEYEEISEPEVDRSGRPGAWEPVTRASY